MSKRVYIDLILRRSNNGSDRKKHWPKRKGTAGFVKFRYLEAR